MSGEIEKRDIEMQQHERFERVKSRDGINDTRR